MIELIVTGIMIGASMVMIGIAVVALCIIAKKGAYREEK